MIKFLYNSLIVMIKEWASFWKAYIKTKIDQKRIRRAIKLATEWNKHDRKTYYILRDQYGRPQPYNNFGIKRLKILGVLPQRTTVKDIYEYCIAIVTSSKIVQDEYKMFRRNKRDKK